MARIEVTDALHRRLNSLSIFQKRTGMRGKPSPKVYPRRWKEGQSIVIRPDSVVEPYSTIAEGDQVPAMGSFTEVASAFPATASFGRFCSVGMKITFIGFRHPVEAASTSSVFFHENREFFTAYARDREAATGRRPAITDPVPTPQPQRGALRIGHDVWIGEGAVLRGGISIGDGAVITGGAVVTKDVAPYTIVGGNPGRVIRDRFPEEICAALQDSRWWEIALEDLLRLPMAEPEALVNAIAQRGNDLTRVKPLQTPLLELLKRPI
jgi:acetyltransferase-like isoleucine patch superfamily enzyme